jgi:hypothetical protein
MNEQEWLACEDPALMLCHLRAVASARKLRLLVCACCRAFFAVVRNEHSRKAVKAAERYADGEVGPDKLGYARASAGRAAQTARRPRRHQSQTTEDYALWLVTWAVAEDVGRGVWSGSGAHWTLSAARRLGLLDKVPLDEPQLLRCVFGNPFCPVTLDRAWLTPTVVSLTQAAYGERLMPSGELDVARLAVLADALEDAGASGQLVEHLRSAGPHVRGCWVLDLILGLG